MFHRDGNGADTNLSFFGLFTKTRLEKKGSFKKKRSQKNHHFEQFKLESGTPPWFPKSKIPRDANFSQQRGVFVFTT